MKLLVLSLAVFVPVSQAALRGIYMNGGDCGVTQFFDPYAWPNNTGVVDFGLKQYHYSASAVMSGRVFIFGGSTTKDGLNQVTDVQIFDPLTNTTTAGAPMLTARSLHTATVVDAEIVICGGLTSRWVHLASCHTYHPYLDMWTKFDYDLPRAVHSHGAAFIKAKNTFYVFGGNTHAGPTADTYSWMTWGGWYKHWPMMRPRADFSTQVTPDGHVVACGGFESPDNNTVIASCEMMDAYSGTWAQYTSMTEGKHYQQMVNFGGSTYVMGGFSDFLGDSVPTIEQYLGYINISWQSYYGMEKPCGGFTAFVINDPAPTACA